jgi:hypothetical protein
LVANPLRHGFCRLALFFLLSSQCLWAAAAAPSVIENLSINGQIDPQQANFILQGKLRGAPNEEQEPKLVYSLHAQINVQVEAKVISQNCDLRAQVFQGKLKEMVLEMTGEGEVTAVTGTQLKDWSVRYGAQSRRFLVIRPIELGTNLPPITNFTAAVSTRFKYDKLPLAFVPITFTPENAALNDGLIVVKATDALALSVTNLSGLSVIRAEVSSSPKHLTPALSPLPRGEGDNDTAPKDQPLQFRYSGADYRLALEVREKDPDLRKVAWENFKLVGDLKGQVASFVLTGDAIVRHPEGGSVEVLSGEVALTGLTSAGEMKYEQARYVLRFRKPGTYPVEVRFNAKVTPQDLWNGISFEVVPGTLRNMVLKGLPADTQFKFSGAAKPERQAADYVTYLPSAGRLQLQWKEARTEELGKLFYSVQGLIKIAVGPGLMRQAHWMEYKVMQGELNQLVFDLTGAGEVTRIRGEDVLNWKIEGPGPDKKRKLVVQLNQSQKDKYAVLIQTQTPLGNFPLQMQPLRLTPVQSIRYGGHLMVINDGAVRMEVTEARGLSQISPGLFPQSKDLAELVTAIPTQSFAYRFSGSDYSLGIQADHILPELSVSQMLIYQMGETETAIDAEMELDIREAPLREFTVRVPGDFTVSRVNVAQLSDYSLVPETDSKWARLKIIFTNPLTGRQVLQLRLEKNQNVMAGTWDVPVLQPQNVKSVRGYVGVTAETGFRLTQGKISGLTEITSAFFPKKVTGLQAAYRLREETWSATLNVERLALSIQADVTHLFTISDGVGFGSSVINYLISGTPVSVLKLEAPAEYNNLEFAGKDVRNWKKTATGYEVYLHTPVFGAYTLLATFDRQFGVQSNTLVFEGVRPLDAQSEQGSVMVVSEFQFEVKPVKVSPGLLQLDPAEIPPENRLLFDAPILAAYQYTTRPFELQLSLHSLAPGETVHQVVDRAVLQTHVSREGEVVTEARYFIKSQGHSHLRISIPAEAQLWEAKVNGTKVVPVADRQETLIPLPPKSDSAAVLSVDLKLAFKAANKQLVKLAAPALAVPVLLTEWNVTPDAQYRLEFQSGNVGLPTTQAQQSGFDWLSLLAHGQFGRDWQRGLAIIPIILLLGVLLLRWAAKQGNYRWGIQHLLGFISGLVLSLVALVLLISLLVFSGSNPISFTTNLNIVAPVQEAGKVLSMQIQNLELGKSGLTAVTAWPVLLGLLLWGYLLVKVEPGTGRNTGCIVGWTLVCWGMLRINNGAPFFFGAVLIFMLIHVLIPSLRSQWLLPRKPSNPTTPEAGALVSLLLLSLLVGGTMNSAWAATSDEPAKNVIQSVVQQARIQEGVGYFKAQLKWSADAGQKLDFLSAPAVLTQINYPQSGLQLSETVTNGLPVHRLTAKESGQFEISFEYQMVFQSALPLRLGRGGEGRGEVSGGSPASSFLLPTPAGLVNLLTLEIEKADVDVFSDQSVSVQATHSKRQEVDITRAELVLAPVAKAAIVWKPRARDPRTEKAVFYAELYQLFVPTAGAVEGIHEVRVRPAQGQLGEVSFQIPAGLTITDVQTDFVSNWRFDPDQHLLRVQFVTPQSRPFTMRLQSQLATSPLPYQQGIGVITVVQAAGQIGMVGVATGTEVQLDAIKEAGLSAINVEDFPTALVTDTAKQFPGIALRRAFRYSEASSQVVISAAAVQPDVRVETQETLSLGEDRTVLASKLTAHITRAGIFKLSFPLPSDFEVESLSGDALSHWTELKSGAERIITMHLQGKTEGDQAFSITLTGPGMGQRKEWEAPRLVLREANKQTGQLVIFPELGMRLHIKTREGLTQLDPQKAGVQQKGVMAFRLLHPRWQLGFDIETVEPWIQVNSLQDVTVREGQLLVTAQIQYQIENAGVKSLLLQLPARAENVRFEGDLISDSVRSEIVPTPLVSSASPLSQWEVKLQRRVIGEYPLRITYQMTMTNQATELRVTGLKILNANLQRGFLAVRTGGRLQIQFPQLPQGLQRTEWQSIPAALRRGRDLTESKDTFSTMETDYELPLTLSRHDIAKVLPARVEKVDLISVVAPSGEMLTEGRLWLRPGDKRLLRLKLPASGQFWYAFVNGQSAWPWREGGQTLLLLDKNSDPAKPTTVEFFYTCQTEGQKLSGFSHQLLGPAFDLPLENITWNVYVPENWQVKDWQSSLQLNVQSELVSPMVLNVDSYLQSETSRQQEKSKEAENLLLMGNDFLQKGVPQQARRAYKSAWKLSSQDAAFNEDARVQLHNLKMQQALLGLNQRRQAAFDYLEKRDGKSQRPTFGRWTPGQVPDYTQQQAQQVFEKNPADENAALMRLAERLIRQQDASVSKPEAIRAALPTQGKQLVFTGSLQVQSWADMAIKLDVRTPALTHWKSHFMVLLMVFVGLVVLAALSRFGKST